MDRIQHDECPACKWKLEPQIVFVIPGRFIDRIFMIKYVKCRACGLIYAQRYPNQEYMYKAYAANYREDTQSYPGSDLRHEILRAKTMTRLLRSVKHIHSLVNFLDVGCSYGTIMRKIHRIYGCPVYGVEPGRRREVAARYGPVTTRIELVEDIRAFHMICLSHVLEHVVEPEDMLQKARRRLSDRGFLYVEVPSENSAIMEPWHPYHFTPMALRVMANRCGFMELMYWEHSGEYVALPGAGPQYMSMLFAPFLDLDGNPIKIFRRSDDGKVVKPYGYD